MRPEALVTPGGQLRKRHRVLRASTGVINALTVRTSGPDLGQQQRRKVARMEGISRLMSCPVKADVAEGPSSKVCVHPIRKDALCRCTELPGAGQYAAASN